MTTKSTNSFRSLKMFLNGLYTISDKDCKFLSDIVNECKASSLNEDGTLLKLKHIIDKYELGFPCSEELLREFWKKEYGLHDFSISIRKILREGFLTYQHLTGNCFFEQVEYRSEKEDTLGESILFGAFYLSEKMRDFLDKSKTFMKYNKSYSLNPIKENSIYISLPPRLKEFVNEFKRGVSSNFSSRVRLDSFIYNESKKVNRVDMVIEGNLVKSLKRNTKVRSLVENFLLSYRTRGVKDFKINIDENNRIRLSISFDERIRGDRVYEAMNYVLEMFKEVTK